MQRRSSALLKKFWPFLVALFLYGWILADLLSKSIRENAGQFIYTLDDPYIHMAIAKNFAQLGVWGVTAYGFTSSTSAPLWTLILSAVYRLVGVNNLAPLVMNILASVGLLALAQYILSRFTHRSWLVFLVLVALVYITPLPSQTLTGMEHLLHALLSLALAFTAASTLSPGHALSLRRGLALAGLAMLLTATRYEGLFLTGAVILLLLIRKHFVPALGVGLAGSFPSLLYGWISRSHGWYFLPNSLLLKTGALNTPPSEWFPQVFANLVEQANENAAVIALLLLSLASWIALSSRREAQAPRVMLILFSLATISHLIFADLGWFYRYEAYLFPLGLTAIAAAFANVLETLPIRVRLKSNLTYAILLLALTLTAISWPRARYALRDTVTATGNIYQQQVQMAHFVKKFYSGQTVAANDIGAINYYAGIRVLDLFGLGSLEPAHLKLEGRYNTAHIESLVREQEVAVVIVYDSWFESYGGFPRSWVKVGEWTIPNNVVCGDDTVSFYAPNPQARAALRNNLVQFSSQLPHGVRSRIFQ